MDAEATNPDYIYKLVAIPTLTGAFARLFFNGLWFYEPLYLQPVALVRQWLIVSLLPSHDSGSAQDKILEALLAVGNRSVEDSFNEEPECLRVRQQSAIFTQGHFRGMPDLLAALDTFILVLEYVWTLREGPAQPQPLFLHHLH